jgi:hypothetical protein
MQRRCFMTWVLSISTTRRQNGLKLMALTPPADSSGAMASPNSKRTSFGNRHTAPGIPQYMPTPGVNVDVLGTGYDDYTPEQRDQVIAAFPRGDDFVH